MSQIIIKPLTSFPPINPTPKCHNCLIPISNYLVKYSYAFFRAYLLSILSFDDHRVKSYDSLRFLFLPKIEAHGFQLGALRYKFCTSHGLDHRVMP